MTELLHKRMTEIVQGVATAYRCTAEITFSDYCHCMVVDKELAGNALTYMGCLLYTSAKLKVKALAQKITPYTGSSNLFVVPYTKPQEYIRDLSLIHICSASTRLTISAPPAWMRKSG